MSYSTTHQPLFDMDIIGGSGEQRQPIHSQCRRTGCIRTYVKCHTIAVLGTLLPVHIAGTGDLVWALFLVPMREVGKGHIQCTCGMCCASTLLLIACCACSSLVLTPLFTGRCISIFLHPSLPSLFHCSFSSDAYLHHPPCASPSTHLTCLPGSL